MKVSFSTLGCPSWTLSEIISTAKDLSYQGIELRGLGEDLFLPDSKLFTSENAPGTKETFESAGLEIPCISTDCRLHEKDGGHMEAALRYISLAGQLGAKAIRLLGDTGPAPEGEIDIELVISRLRELAESAKASGVILLLESNGVFANTELLRRTLDAVGNENVGALWDIHHPFRYFGETPEESYSNLAPYIRHIHIKDSKMENGVLTYKMLGYGDLPIKESFALLKNAGYEGYISLEWTKRHNAELEDPGIVFSHFIYAVRKTWANA